MWFSVVLPVDGGLCSFLWGCGLLAISCCLVVGFLCLSLIIVCVTLVACL